jgi:hypothetical protein
MRERHRVDILRNPLAAQGFLSIVDLAAVIVLDPETRAVEPA